MRRAAYLSAALLAVCFSCASSRLLGQDTKPESRLNTGTLSALKFRSIGPALMSGRIADLAIDPVKPNTWYVAVGSGNVWKTENAGTTWTPIFDDYASYSIGCLALDPSDRHTIWVGTGENVSGRHVGYGDGVYVSHDGGKSFKNMGLKATEHISKIIIDPRDSQTIYVAAQGPLWSSGGERGVFKSTDGGKSWTAVLTQGPWTGATDMAMDPNDPDVLYVATHQRHRTVWAVIDGGPETGIFKSTDAGASWTELTSGLPSADMGKIGLAVSPQKSNVVYAGIELAGRRGGVWRSANGGATWKKMSDYVAGGTGPHYYQEIYCDPHRFDVFYHADVRLGRTTDGGATFNSVGNSNKHSDNHAVAFHPTDPDFLLVGCDGGIYRSWDYAKTYQYSANLPLTQFYKVDVDYDEPFYHVVGGTQDNATQHGPVQTGTVSGIRNADWRVTIGGDGHDCAIDPQDPDTIYCESQQGYLRRFDRRTGQSIDIRPQPAAGEEAYRFNWDSPILISPHSHTRLYFASQKLHRSDDRGDSWRTISPDLSRGVDRFTLPHMGRVWSIDAMWDLYAMSQYGTITSISESPVQEDLIYVGTDDGLIQVTEDGGKNWRRIDRIYGIPEGSFVNDIKADLYDANRVYAVLDNHKTGDFAPYLVRSDDRGQTWTSMTGNLPARHLLWRIIQDHVERDLFFVATEFGIYYTRDGGQRWTKLPGTPTISFRDLEIQRRENDLVGASFGRSFYVLDDYTPLRTMDDELLAKDFHMFSTRPAKLYIPDRILGGPRGSQGDSYFIAPNPPFGAVFTYYLKDTLRTREDERQAREKEIKQEGGDNTYPGWDALRQERREQEPQLTFTICDDAGHTVRRITGPVSAGTHRIAWDLRYGSFTGGSGNGPLVVPGTYTVQVSRRVAGKTETLGEPQEFQVVSIVKPTLEPQDQDDVLKFQLQVCRLQRKVVGASNELSDTLEQIDKIQQVIANSPDLDPALHDQAQAVKLELLDVQIELTGDRLKAERSQTSQVPILNRVQTALSGTLRQTYGPTKTHREQYRIAQRQFKQTSSELEKVFKQYAALLKALDKAGAPWTPGR
jgi:photosystem II stability/assembly factor-like uncharacterized protein